MGHIMAEAMFRSSKVIKRNLKLEMPGIEPGAFHMQSERATTALHPLLVKSFQNVDVFQGVAVYKVGSPPGIQYLATGGSDDWAKGVAGIKWVFLIELPDR